MSFSYNAAIDTYLNRARLLVSDTNSSNYLFSDEEISLFSKIYGENAHYIAGACCRALAANKALQAIFFSIHDRDIQIDKRDIPKYFITLAKMYETAEANITIVEYLDSVDYTVDDYGVIGGEMVGDDELY